MADRTHKKRPRDPNRLGKMIVRITPAMAAGVADRVWDVKDIVAVLET